MSRARIAALAGLAALALLVPADAQGANDVARVDNVGWWTKRPAAQPLSGPTSFEVASGPDGDESVAALRILISGSVTKATLSLSEVANMGTAAVSVPKLRACPTDTPWVLTTNPGQFADAPKPACDKGTAPLTRDATGNWSADVTGMLAGNRSEVSIMVVPAPDSSLPIPPTFIIDIATSRVGTEGTPDVESAPAPAPEPSATVTTVARPAVPVAPVHGSAPVTPTTAAVAATPATPTVTAATVVPNRLGGVRLASTKKPKEWGKLFLLVPLSVLVGFGWVFARKYAIERGALAATS